MLGKLEGWMGLEEFPTYRQEGANSPTLNFLPLFVVFTLAVYVLETYLDFRQHTLLKAKSPPSSLLGVLKNVDADNTGLDAVTKVTGNDKKPKVVLENGRCRGAVLFPGAKLVADVSKSCWTMPFDALVPKFCREKGDGPVVLYGFKMEEIYLPRMIAAGPHKKSRNR